jgi:hypothetical protein
MSKKRVLCFNQFLELSLMYIDLKKTFWTRIRTIPIPNSTADKTKKKKVSERRFMLS